MSPSVLYEERVSSVKTEALFRALTALFFLLWTWRATSSGFDVLTAVFLLLALLFLFYSINYRLLVIRITPEALRLQFGIFSWTVPLNNVASSGLDDHLPVLAQYGGAGIHFMFVRGRYRASFNFLEHPRVIISLTRSRLVRDVSFSTQRPDEVLRQLRGAAAMLT